MAKEIYGIAGYPVKHSLSPAMQNAAFKELGIDAEYRLFEVTPAGLEDFLNSAAEKNISGLNITIPHKIKTREYLDRHGKIDENAKRLGAVNTIKTTKECLCGYNTDGPGFYRSLVEDLSFEPEGKNILVLGAGGAASAVITYLGNGPKKIFVTDIDKEKCAALKSRYKLYYDANKLEVIKADRIEEILSLANLLVNATPMGMEESDPMPIDKNLLKAGLYVYDLVYNRPMTELVKAANSVKAHAVTGLGMLLYQGAIAFEKWTGKKAPLAVMKKALKKALSYKS